MLSDSSLRKISFSDANRLSLPLKRRWVEIHNCTANIFFLSYVDGLIHKVPPEGWWY